MKINDVNIDKLADVFVKYNYFSEDKTDLELETYGVLLEVYDALTQDGKDKILQLYKIKEIVSDA